MKSVLRVFALICALQILAILLGHAGAVAGNSWLLKVYDSNPEKAPAINLFYLHHGLWLLFIPLIWFSLSLIITRSVPRAFVDWFCLITGALLLLFFVVSGIGAFLSPVYSMAPWHGGSWRN